LLKILPAFKKITLKTVNTTNMKLRELFEASDKHVTFCFGRMNPPTIGHGQLLETMAGVGGDFKIFLSQTQDKKRNPLDYSTKIKFLKAIFPEYAKNVVDNSSLNTIGKVASYLYSMGYRNATFVAGSDRLPVMSKLLQDYNGVEGKDHGYYKFNVLDFESSGDRDPDADGVAGISASGARDAAANNDFKTFKASIGSDQYANSLFKAVRQGLGIKEVEPAEAMMPTSSFSGSKKNKLGPSAHLKGTGKRPARAGDLVG